MKILIIRNYPSFMNIEKSTYNIQELGLAKAIVRKGHICDILFWTNAEEKTITVPVDNGGEVKVFYRRGKTALKNVIFTGCKDLFENYDILQSSEYNQLQSVLLAKKYPYKTIIYHGPYYSSFNKRYNLMCRFFDAFFLKNYIKRQTKFIVKSNKAKVFLESKGIKKENISALGVGIDLEALTNKNDDCGCELLKTIAADKDNLKLLYIGRFNECKNIKFIIDVFGKVLESHPHARMYMIGTGEEEYMKNAFLYMEKLKVRDKVVWQEKMMQKDLPKVYCCADFFLLPSEYEIFGMVLLEAMYFGNVVLTTDNGGADMLIKNGKNGIILDNKNAQQWADKILTVYNNKKLYDSVSKQAAELISKNFTWDILAEKFLEKYSEVLSIN